VPSAKILVFLLESFFDDQECTLRFSFATDFLWSPVFVTPDRSILEQNESDTAPLVSPARSRRISFASSEFRSSAQALQTLVVAHFPARLEHPRAGIGFRIRVSSQ
jgi:hypothetical protein